MKTKTISERGRIYIDRNGGDSDGRNRLFNETSKKSHDANNQSQDNKRNCAAMR